MGRANEELGGVDTGTLARTRAVAHMTWRCVCNCSVFNPAMCLLSRHIHITVPSTHTHTHTQQSLCFCLYRLPVTIHTHQLIQETLTHAHNSILCLQKPAEAQLTSWPSVIAADWFIQGEQIAVFLPFNEREPPPPILHLLCTAVPPHSHVRQCYRLLRPYLFQN